MRRRPAPRPRPLPRGLGHSLGGGLGRSHGLGRSRTVGGGRVGLGLRGVRVGLGLGGGLLLLERAGQHGLARTEHHRHVAPVEVRPLLDDGEVDELLGQAVEDHAPALGVGHLTATEHDGDLHLVLVAEEALDVTLLGVVVVLGDLRPELDLPDDDLLLVLARLLLLLGELVLELGVVQDAADGRTGLRRHLDQVEISLLRHAQGLVGPHDPDLLAVIADDADLGDADALVDAGGVPLGRAPVEPSRNRH
nr:hypothetical protein [Baekduia soli]